VQEAGQPLKSASATVNSTFLRTQHSFMNWPCLQSILDSRFSTIDDRQSVLARGSAILYSGRRQRRPSYQPTAKPWVHSPNSNKALKARLIWSRCGPAILTMAGRPSPGFRLGLTSEGQFGAASKETEWRRQMDRPAAAGRRPKGLSSAAMPERLRAAWDGYDCCSVAGLSLAEAESPLMKRFSERDLLEPAARHQALSSKLPARFFPIARYHLVA